MPVTSAAVRGVSGPRGFMKSTWIIFIFLSFVPLKSFAEFDYTDLVGEWASYKLNQEFGSSYYYLRIDSDYSGEFGFMSKGFEGKGFSFTSEEVTFNDGILLIKPKVKGQPKFVATVSGSEALLDGTVFMYQSFDNDVWQLFNTLHLGLFRLSPKVLELVPEINEHRTKK